jgi:PBP1b-binding outer membrane lipoprotein LpoB
MMKQSFFTIAVLCLLAISINSCSKTDNNAVVSTEISQEVKARISALGFHTDEVQAVEGGFVVEGDIFIPEADLYAPAVEVQRLIVANTEQYRTTNLVTGLPRNIKVRVTTTLPASIVTATDATIARYNAQGLQLTFTRVTSGGNIVISKAPNGAGYIASAGFPSGGNPFNSIKFNANYATWNANTLASVIAHEIGHCIGFRHTDYMDRSYSCGGAFYNEGSGGVGAINIPGTPTGPDANSWMLACIGNGINRPFNANDVTALNFLY